MIITRLVRLLGTAAVSAGLAVGLATLAAAQPAEDDFWECVGDHQDTDGIGVCCVFYGGDFDDASQACYIDFPAENAPQTRPTTHPLPGVPVQTTATTYLD